MKDSNKNQRHMYALIRALSCIVALAALVLVLYFSTDFLKGILPEGSTPKTASFEAPAALTSCIASGPRKEFADLSQALLPDFDAIAQANAANASPESTSHTISNTPIDLTSLDTSAQGWGPGQDCDERNRPYSTLSYQEKYAKYNAHFIVPDSDKIYLTFDEGYENGCTADILNVLKEKNTPAVFFITMQYAKQNPELVQRMIDEGHMVGAHSVTHPAKGLPSLTIEKQQEEITKLHEYVKENFNYEMHLFRFPSGIFSEQSLAIVNNCNYKSVFWSFAYLDYDTENQPDPAQALDKVKSRLHPGAIYLLHAVSTTNTAILGDFIDYIQAEGYEIGLLD